MKPKKYKILLDLYKGVLNNQLIEFTTEDNQQSILEFELLEDKATPYDLTGCLVRMVIAGQQQDCTIIDAAAGNVKVVLLQSMFSDTGFITAELQIYDDTNQTLRLTTPRFRYTVKKSLIDDNTAQADPNFSILQTMILEVSNANEVANAAKATAESALSKANQAVTTIDGQVSKVNTAVSSANAALDRAESVVTQEELANKIGHNGVFDDTNFNFIENKVVQDGLIDINTSISSSADLSTYLICNGVLPNQFLIRIFSVGTSGYTVEAGSTGILRVRYFDEQGTSKISTLRNLSGLELTFNNYTLYKISLVKIKHTFYAIVNNEIYVSEVITSIKEKVGIPESAFSLKYLYTRPLTHKEIQHNLTVLNNAPSINTVSVADKKLLLASDTDHVTDRTGRTQQRINQVFYSQNGKEFIAGVDGKISVNNGLEGWVNKAEITGQTVKNICRFSGATESSDKITVYNTFVANNNNYSLKNFTDKPIFLQIYNTLGNTWVRNASVGAGQVINITSDEMIKTISGTFASGWSVNDKALLSNTCMIVPTSDINKVTSYIPFGLNSTQAIINNNGNLFPIYHQMVEGKTRILDGKLISLKPSVEGLEVLKDVPSGICDTIDLARSLLSLNTFYGVLNGSLTYTNNGAAGDLIEYIINSYPTTISIPSGQTSLDIRCFNLPIKISTTESCIFMSAGKLRIRLLNTINPTSYFTQNPTEVIYPIATPIQTQLTDEELKAYDQYKKLILCGGVGDVRDTLEIKEDGSGVYTQNRIKVNLSNLVVSDTFDSSSTNTYRISASIPNVKNASNGVCTHFDVITSGTSSNDTQNICVVGSIVYIRILKTNVPSGDLAGCIKYLKDNSPIADLQISIPIVTTIDKSITPTILTDKINILSVESPVMPWSFKATLPIDKMAEMEARLLALEAKTNTAAVNVTFIEETYQSSQNKINEVIK